MGYNYGAREHARVKKLFQLTLLMSAAIMAAGTVICQFASGQLMGLFTQNPETIAAGQTALRIIAERLTDAGGQCRARNAHSRHRPKAENEHRVQ